MTSEASGGLKVIVKTFVLQAALISNATGHLQLRQYAAHFKAVSRTSFLYFRLNMCLWQPFFFCHTSHLCSVRFKLFFRFVKTHILVQTYVGWDIYPMMDRLVGKIPMFYVWTKLRFGNSYKTGRCKCNYVVDEKLINLIYMASTYHLTVRNL